MPMRDGVVDVWLIADLNLSSNLVGRPILRLGVT